MGEHDDAIRDAARHFLAMEARHRRQHELHGLTESLAVYEQQTGHRVCAWCGYCEGGCNVTYSTTDQFVTIGIDHG